MQIKPEHLEQLKKEVQHIFDGGANEVRVYNMIQAFIENRGEALFLPIVIQRFKPLEEKPVIPEFNGQGIKSCVNTNCMYLSTKHNCPWSKGDQLNCKDRKVLNDL